MESSKHFRPEDVGARQRLIHWLNAVAALGWFVFTGPAGLVVFMLGLLIFHGRANRVRGHNLMDYLLDNRERALASEWKDFQSATRRRTLSLAGRRPHPW